MKVCDTMLVKKLLTILWLVSVAACSSLPTKPDHQSGFLANYEGFKPNPRADNSWVRSKPGITKADFQSYQKVAVAPIEVWLNGQTQQMALTPAMQKDISAYFQAQIAEGLKGHYQMVPEGTADALVINMAFTNISESKPGMSPLDVLPFRIVTNAGKNLYRLVANKKAVIGKASLEASFVDANSSDELAAIIVSHSSGAMNVEDTPDNVDSIKAVVDHWGARLVDTLVAE